jgi:hypothetical protein
MCCRVKIKERMNGVTCAEQEVQLAKVDNEAAARARESVPAELLDMLREAKRNAIKLHALQQRKEATHVVEFERRFKVFDDRRLLLRLVRFTGAGPLRGPLHREHGLGRQLLQQLRRRFSARVRKPMRSAPTR